MPCQIQPSEADSTAAHVVPPVKLLHKRLSITGFSEQLGIGVLRQDYFNLLITLKSCPECRHLRITTMYRKFYLHLHIAVRLSRYKNMVAQNRGLEYWRDSIGCGPGFAGDSRDNCRTNQWASNSVSHSPKATARLAGRFQAWWKEG